MQSMTPSSQYLQALREGSHQPDDVQRDAVSRLDAIYQQLVARPEPQSSRRRPAGNFQQAAGQKEAPAAAPPVRGLYMWGGVGRGKTADGHVLSEPSGQP